VTEPPPPPIIVYVPAPPPVFVPPAPIIVNITKNVTVSKVISLDGPTFPLYGSIVIMFCIVSGVFLYLCVDHIQRVRDARRRKEKVNITDLTDFELRPIE
jgi:hypothetical protein